MASQNLRQRESAHLEEVSGLILISRIQLSLSGLKVKIAIYYIASNISLAIEINAKEHCHWTPTN